MGWASDVFNFIWFPPWSIQRHVALETAPGDGSFQKKKPSVFVFLLACLFFDFFVFLLAFIVFCTATVDRSWSLTLASGYVWPRSLQERGRGPAEGNKLCFYFISLCFSRWRLAAIQAHLMWGELYWSPWHHHGNKVRGLGKWLKLDTAVMARQIVYWHRITLWWTVIQVFHMYSNEEHSCLLDYLCCENLKIYIIFPEDNCIPCISSTLLFFM